MGEKFEYKYSAPTLEEQNEINTIRNQYLPKNQTMTKIERLRYLDNKVKNIPLIWSLSFGVIGILLFGFGLTFFLEWSNYWYFGLPFGIIGILLMVPAHAIYKKLQNKYKKKYSQEIIDLSNELLNENDKN